MDNKQETNALCCRNFLTAYQVVSEILAYYRINSAQFCLEIGVNPTYVNDAKKGKTKKISEEVAGKILSKFPEINRIWLLTGEGEMLRTDNSIAQSTVNGDNLNNGSVKYTSSTEDAARYDRLISLLEKEHEERSRLLAIIENLTSKQ